MLRLVVGAVISGIGKNAIQAVSLVDVVFIRGQSHLNKIDYHLHIYVDKGITKKKFPHPIFIAAYQLLHK